MKRGLQVDKGGRDRQSFGQSSRQRSKVLGCLANRIFVVNF